VARLCQAHLRAEDRVGRFGGEEIALVLPGTTLDEALLVCERLREVVAGHDWDALAPGLRVTLSVGISAYRAGLDVAGMLAEADAYLYQAKRAGRNRTCCALTQSSDQSSVSRR
jgi:diguanylate cyclase (GGDEF)-like protein